MKIDTSKNDTAMRVGSNSYVDNIESKHPGYLHYIYRYSIKTYRAKSSFQLLSAGMNKKSDAPNKHRPTTRMSRKQLNN